jgi:glucokinase
MELLMAGDVGATKTTLALYSKERDLRDPIARSTFSSASYKCFEDLINDFLVQSGASIACMALGVAGPVEGGTARITNLTWVIDTDRLSSMFGAGQIHLLNDLEAVALGIPLLDEGDLRVLNEGQPTKHGPMAVIAPGTGLGEAYLTWDGSRYQAYASEGGHSDFAPRDLKEIALLEYLLERYSHVSYERICSGSGIPNIYAFLRDKGYHKEPAWLAEELSRSSDPTVVIRETAQSSQRTCGLCRETLRMFVSILGAETGNMALKLLPSGGIYLGGGISPRIIEMLEDGVFLNAFFSKGRLSRILNRIPISVILNTDIGLLGAASFGMDTMNA